MLFLYTIQSWFFYLISLNSIPLFFQWISPARSPFFFAIQVERHFASSSCSPLLVNFKFPSSLSLHFVPLGSSSFLLCHIADLPGGFPSFLSFVSKRNNTPHMRRKFFFLTRKNLHFLVDIGCNSCWKSFVFGFGTISVLLFSGTLHTDRGGLQFYFSLCRSTDPTASDSWVDLIFLLLTRSPPFESKVVHSSFSFRRLPWPPTRRSYIAMSSPSSRYDDVPRQNRWMICKWYCPPGSQEQPFKLNFSFSFVLFFLPFFLTIIYRRDWSPSSCLFDTCFTPRSADLSSSGTFVSFFLSLTLTAFLDIPRQVRKKARLHVGALLM